MPRSNPKVRERAGHCPLCDGQLSAIPMQVGPDYIRYELRCYGPHTEEDLSRARGVIFGRVEPGG